MFHKHILLSLMVMFHLCYVFFRVETMENGMTKVDIVLEKTQLNDQIITAIGTVFRDKLQQINYNIDTDNVTMEIVGRPDFYYGFTKPGRLTTIINCILFACLARCFVIVVTNVVVLFVVAVA